MCNNPQDLSDLDVRDFQRLIQWKVRRFLLGLTNYQDPEDACADVMVQLLDRLSSYNPSRGSLRTFASRTVDSILLDIRRRHSAKKRARNQPRSLNAPTTDRDGKDCELWELLDETQLKRHLALEEAAPIESVNLRLDLDDAAASLSHKQRRLLKQILAGQSPTDVAIICQVARGTTYRQLKAIGNQLRKTGLEEYLRNSATDDEHFRKS